MRGRAMALGIVCPFSSEAGLGIGKHPHQNAGQSGGLQAPQFDDVVVPTAVVCGKTDAYKYRHNAENGSYEADFGFLKANS
jgi:hypothetical protein